LSNHPTITNAPTTNIHTGSFTDYYATPDTWRTHQSTMRVTQALNSSLFGRSQNAIYGDGYLTTFSA
jgi:protein phosphatase